MGCFISPFLQVSEEGYSGDKQDIFVVVVRKSVYYFLIFALSLFKILTQADIC